MFVSKCKMRIVLKFILEIYPMGVYNGRVRKVMELEKECCSKKKIRSEQEFKSLMNRLNRIEGQVRGIKGMLEQDAYCIDILTQVAAVNAALNSFNKVLLAEHIKTCVVNDVQNGNGEAIDELVKTLQKLMK